jgi:CBS domain-containing protein
MAQTVRDIMTSDPLAVSPDTTVDQVARLMRDNDTGAILVTEGDRVRGIVTDRDIAVRCVAEAMDPTSTAVSRIATMDVVTISPDSNVEDAIRMMREQAIRRIPVVENGRAVGILSIGDLAIERDSQSALADISAARQNN